MTEDGGSRDGLSPGPVDRVRVWEASMPTLSAEAAEIKAAGGWRRGPRTVLEALGLEQSELKLVKLLGWLLSPDGHHGLGNSVVAALFERLGVPYAATDEVDVRLEEARFSPIDGALTRADLVVRTGRRCVLIEAKARASEQPEQCDRLARLWRDESPTLVFLTPRGDLPTTALCPDDAWIPMSWGDVVEVIKEALPSHVNERCPGAPGVWDYTETLRLFQSGQRSLAAMTDVEATRFYMRHWKRINEWASLRDEILRSIDAGLGSAFGDSCHLDAPGAQQGIDATAGSSYPTFELLRPHWPRISIAAQWQPQPRSATPWPYVGIRAYKGWPRNRRLVLLLDTLRPHVAQLNWPEYDLADPFLCWKYIEPADGDLSHLGELCRAELERGWRELADPIERFLANELDEAGA